MKKVEDFRLTKDQVGWMKEVRKVNRVETMLREKVLSRWLQQGRVLRETFNQLAEAKRMLGIVTPDERMDDLPQQTVEDMRKREDIIGVGGEQEVFAPAEGGRRRPPIGGMERRELL